jgi:hypothetical protein
MNKHSSRRLPRRRAALAVGAVLATACGALVLAQASEAATNATTVLSAMTRPAGGVWLPGPNGGPGHYWTPDLVSGFCRVDPTATGFATSHCNAAVKSAGQAVYDATHQVVYVPDQSSKSTQLVRFNYDQANEAVTGPLVIQVPNNTAVGGGTSGGRTASLALNRDGSKLFVGYIKSGDVMAVTNPYALTNGGKAQLGQVGSTSDGRGSSGGFAMLEYTNAGVAHSDLYLAEIGGKGLSMIPDITGTPTRPACGSPTPCGAVTVTNSTGGVVSSFPSGIVTDGTTLYVGDSPPNVVSQILAFTPASGAQRVYSTDVPAYTSGFDGKTRTKYESITGIGLAPNGDLYVGDDPTATLATVTNNQGHLWRVPFAAPAPAVTGIAPAGGPTSGGTVVTFSGTGLNLGGTPTVRFGPATATAVSCTSSTTCTATSPTVAGAGPVDVTVTTAAGQTSPLSASDVFTYTTPPPATAITVTGIAPTSGVASGGTAVTITGANMIDPAGGPTTVSFGASAATGVSCASATTCTAISPAGTGTVDVQVSAGGHASAVSAADRFSYVQPVAALQAHGITAPKGGVVFIPGALGGHFWSSDHSQGFCRLDPVPGSKLLAINPAACDPGFTLGSPGQATYDPGVNADGTHNVYVPDNAVRSPGVWRLTFDPKTETVGNPVGMAPGQMDNLKTNSTALSPDGTALFVGDLVDGGIRRINNIGADPRTQTVDIIATTQPQKAGVPSRGINGTMSMIGNLLFLPENNAATYVDTSAACAAVGTTTPCATTSLNFLANPAPVFVAGVGADPARKLLYISSSPGGANATIFRFDASTISAANPGGSPGSVYVSNGNVPAAGTPEATVWCSLTCTRPADPAMTPGGTTGFAFAQGVVVDATDGSLLITEDATAGARGGRGHLWRVPFIA